MFIVKSENNVLFQAEMEKKKSLYYLVLQVKVSPLSSRERVNIDEAKSEKN